MGELCLWLLRVCCLKRAFCYCLVSQKCWRPPKQNPLDILQNYGLYSVTTFWVFSGIWFLQCLWIVINVDLYHICHIILPIRTILYLQTYDVQIRYISYVTVVCACSHLSWLCGRAAAGLDKEHSDLNPHVSLLSPCVLESPFVLMHVL